jgi:hypothetical protein
MKKQLYLCILTLAFVSCKSSYQTMSRFQPNQPIEIIQKKPITTIIIDEKEKVEGVAQEIVYLGIFRSGPSAFMELPDQRGTHQPNLKEAAIFNALYEKGFDVIILPRFTTIINKDLFKTVTTVKVTGYGGNEIPIKSDNSN